MAALYDRGCQPAEHHESAVGGRSCAKRLARVSPAARPLACGSVMPCPAARSLCILPPLLFEQVHMVRRSRRQEVPIAPTRYQRLFRSRISVAHRLQWSACQPAAASSCVFSATTNASATAAVGTPSLVTRR